eukprot:sb/3473756/
MFLVLLTLLNLAQSAPILYDNFTFYVNGDCTLDQQLFVYDSSTSPLNRHPICSSITSSQMNQICQILQEQGSKCGGTNGIVVNTTATRDTLPLTLNEDQLLFETDNEGCFTRIICYNETSQCTLPSISNGEDTTSLCWRCLYFGVL